jgi:nitroreductase/NAD-dependent dihydropyrimidine dehydrogenase PreA subunit
MNPVVFDYEKCTGDGLCVAVCPRKLIEQDTESSKPTTIAEAPELCINCGHCLAVCPSGAISLNGVYPEDCLTTNKNLHPRFDQVDLLLRSRRSIRAYKNRPAENKIIEQLLDTCRYAPSGSNTQPVSWIVASGDQRLRKLAQLVIDWMEHAIETKNPVAERMHLDVVVDSWRKGEDRIFRGAPAVIVSHAPQIGSLPLENCIIAMTYLDVVSASLGLGTCWVGYLMLAASQYAVIGDALEIPRDHRLFGAMVVGYPKYSYQRIPPRNQLNLTWW